MKLYQQFAEKGYHTCIVTTFGLDFDTYETVVLPRLRGAGCRNNIVVADGRMLTLALDGRSSLPARAGSHYTVSGVRGNGGVFHPKLFLQVGRDRGRLMVGSANMTAAGLAGNLELIATFRSRGTGDAERQLIVQGVAPHRNVHFARASAPSPMDARSRPMACRRGGRERSDPPCRRRGRRAAAFG